MNTNVGISTGALEPAWARFIRQIQAPRRAAPRRESIRHRSGSGPARILEDVDGIVVEAEIAGFGPDDIDIVLSDRVLAIRAEDEEGTPGRPAIEQTFDLPHGIDVRGVKAELRGHLLRVTLPRAT